MNTEELSNRLTQIVQGITNTHPIRIKATIEVFLEEFDPSQNYLLSISDIEGYERPNLSNLRFGTKMMALYQV